MNKATARYLGYVAAETSALADELGLDPVAKAAYIQTVLSQSTSVKLDDAEGESVQVPFKDARGQDQVETVVLPPMPLGEKAFAEAEAARRLTAAEDKKLAELAAKELEGGSREP